jgi:Holliday junction resolvase
VVTRVNSRRKGKVGELAAAKYLRSLGFDARRGCQYAGGPDSPDLTAKNLPNVHIEVKFGVAGLDLGTQKLAKACDQAASECGGKAWCVLWKPPRARQWRLTFSTYKLFGCHGAVWATIDDNAEIRNVLNDLNAAQTRGGEQGDPT